MVLLSFDYASQMIQKGAEITLDRYYLLLEAEIDPYSVIIERYAVVLSFRFLWGY